MSLPAPSASSKAALHPLALLSLDLTGVGLLLASVPGAAVASKPLSAAGLLLALLAILAVWRLPTASPKLLPLAAAAAAGLTLLLAGPWPGEAPPDEPLPPSQVLVIPSGDRGMARYRPLGAQEWLNARRGALQHVGVRVQVTGASVGFAPLIQGGKKQPAPTRTLTVQLWVANTRMADAATFLLDYTPWAALAARGEAPTLTDAAGRSYPLARLPPGWKPEGQPDPCPLYNGHALEDVLAFEAPPRAGPLRLELPAGAFGGTKPLRFEIPSRMIEGR